MVTGSYIQCSNAHYVYMYATQLKKIEISLSLVWFSDPREINVFT